MDATVQLYVTQLSNGEASLPECGRFYVDVLTYLGTIPILTRLDTTVAASGTMVQAGDAVAMLLAFFGGSQLGELSVREANWLLPDWREATGTPYNFVRESYNAKEVQLVPIPTSGSGNMLVSYYTDVLPTWLQMPVALLVLESEYRRESNHQNLELAKACATVAQLLLNALTNGNVT